MIEPFLATIIMIALAVFLLILIPFLDSHARLGKYISLRYTLVSIFLILGVGCVLDFSHLDTASRNIVLGGAVALVALFVIVRSLEKIKIGARNIEIEAHKGDLGGSVKVNTDGKS